MTIPTSPEVMKRSGRQAFWALAICLVSGSALADGYQEARQILERMAASLSQLSYQGTFVYVRGEDVETMRITHVSNDDGTRERMYAVSGPQREIIRDADGVRCALGSEGSVAPDPLISRSLFPELPVEELAEAGNRYWFKIGGFTRIAGHKGRRLTILPRDEYRYGYDLWLEEDSGLLLRWVLYDADRRTLAKLMFTDLTIGEGVDASELESATPSDEFVQLPPPPDTKKPTIRPGRRLNPEGMPPGFRLAARSVGEVGVEPGLQHLVYSDGLASVSVYIEERQDAGGVKDGLSRLGTTNAFSRTAGSRQVTAIGEVPPITVKTITNAFAAPLIAAD